MKRRLLTLALLALVAVVPAAGQEVVGFLEPPVVPSATPDGLAPLHGVVRVFGWVVVENETVRRVTIQVDGVDVGEAFYHRRRPVVTEFLDTNFPGSVFGTDDGDREGRRAHAIGVDDVHSGGVLGAERAADIPRRVQVQP